MKLPRYPWRRNAAVIAAAAIVGALGVGGVVSAQADSQGGTGHSTVDQSDGDGEQNDATEADNDGEQNDATEVENDAETNDDASDTGPDANPNEPGHQDASDGQ
jgi:hypothetical protein